MAHGLVLRSARDVPRQVAQLLLLCRPGHRAVRTLHPESRRPRNHGLCRDLHGAAARCFVKIDRIRLADFRNYADLDFAPEPGLNILVGPNAQGKSNLLEALAMLATGKSFRAHRESELIRSGAERAEIGGEARIAAGEIWLRCTVARTPAGARKSFEVNGGTVGFARFLGRTRVVTFVPADLQLVSGGPALRRSFLNGALAQLSPVYYRDLALYQKVIAQKSALLRGAIAPDRDLLLAYNDELVRPATALIAARRGFVDELAAATAGVYGGWPGPRERLGVT